MQQLEKRPAIAGLFFDKNFAFSFAAEATETIQAYGNDNAILIDF